MDVAKWIDYLSFVALAVAVIFGIALFFALFALVDALNAIRDYDQDRAVISAPTRHTLPAGTTFPIALVKSPSRPRRPSASKDAAVRQWRALAGAMRPIRPA